MRDALEERKASLEFVIRDRSVSRIEASLGSLIDRRRD